MEKHPYFDLWLHDDTELADALGTTVQARATLHEWPLSCVQQVTLGDGRCVIYKTQVGPTVEAAFYARARSPLLVATTILAESDSHAQMVLDYVDAPRLEDLDLQDDAIIATGRYLIAQISVIDCAGDDWPVLVDISTPDRWLQMVEHLVDEIQALIESQSFTQVSAADLDDIRAWARSAAVMAAIESRAGLVHEDFTADNIFKLPAENTYKVIDWQRVVKGPPDVMLALLLDSMDRDPVVHLGAGITAIMLLLRIRHLVVCARVWFPPGIPTYDGQVANLIARLRGLC
jgi:hypothetical protein